VALVAAAISAQAQLLVQVYVYDYNFSINPMGGPVVDAVINAGDTARRASEAAAFWARCGPISNYPHSSQPGSGAFENPGRLRRQL
jgi:hypothetical protein